MGQTPPMRAQIDPLNMTQLVNMKRCGLGLFFFFLQWIFGFVVFFYPGGSGTLRGESLPWHVVLGVTVFVLAVGNASLGFLEKLTFLENSGLAKYGSEAFLVNFTAIVTILFGASVILSVLCEGQASGDHSYSAI